METSRQRVEHEISLLPDGSATWRMGSELGGGRAAGARAGERRPAPRLEIGYRLIDTAEMYGEGGAEERRRPGAWRTRCGPARLRRDDVFVVSKVYPHNAKPRGTVAACERSLPRLGPRSPRPLSAALARQRAAAGNGRRAFETLRSRRQDPPLGRQQLRRRRHGRAVSQCAGGERCATNQVYYSLSERGPELRARSVAAAARHADDGLFARSTRARCARRRGSCASDARPGASVPSGAAGPRLAPVADRRDGHSQGRARGASARELRRRCARR